MDIDSQYPEHERNFVHEEYMYVNSGGVMAGDNDFIINLETNIPSGIVRNQYLMMTPRMAKQFRNMLDEAITHYEKNVDEIYLGTKIVHQYDEDEQMNGRRE